MHITTLMLSLVAYVMAFWVLFAKTKDGNILKAEKMTGVTDKQVDELGISITPMHPETELKKAGALFESETKFRDVFANHTVVDDEKDL